MVVWVATIKITMKLLIGGRTMEKYDCKKCIHNGKGSVFHRNKKCENCTVDSKNIYGKPSNFKGKKQ